MSKLDELNSADREQASALLRPMVERAPEITQKVASRRPFASVGDLRRAIREALLGLDENERIALFRAHPELAPVDPSSMTSESQSEQARLKLTADNHELRSRFDELNARYREKFGFPFITALVRHEDTNSVLAEFETRLAADRESEIAQALEQVITVSSARVEAAFEEGDADSLAAGETAEHAALGWGGEIGGLVLLGLAIVFMVGGWELGLGVPTRLGTGAFPFFSGAILAILAIVICIEERRGDGIAEAPDWIALLAISAALAIFALLAERLCLVPAAFLTVVVASLPDRSLPFKGKVLLGGIVSLGCWGLFIEALNLPFKPFVGL